MDIERKINQLQSDVSEIKALLLQIKAPEFKPTIEQELDAIKAQGLDISETMHARCKEKMKAARTRRGAKK